MATLWFVLVGLMITVYVVLDGFDLGAGAIHLLIAKSNDERRLILRAVGPVWDGNEVWLLAAGGTLYFAFPALYASSFSGFYLPLTMVLWLLMIRAIGIEFRGHLSSQLWRSFFDVAFSISSVLLTVFFGAALGNVIRGVPLNDQGYFFEPLWTTFTITSHPGILDWYTVIVGVTALAVLASHGALYIATKTEGELNARARHAASILWWAIAALTVAGLIATLSVRPRMLDNYKVNPAAGSIFPIIVLAALGGMIYFRTKGNDKASFISSVAYIVGMLGGVAFGLYPNLLPASTDPAYDITIHTGAASEYGLKVGLAWWIIGIAGATAYFFYIYRSFRGKVSLTAEGEHY
jgi:cytochrome bd ubiquinol oxidase subunit II